VAMTGFGGKMIAVRGVRGATDVVVDEPGAVLRATRQLLEAMLEANPKLKPEDLASVIFTVTPDLSSEYPAKAARELGWRDVPLLCTCEIPVPGGLPRIVRALAHWNTELPQNSIKHVYLGEAIHLRPDLKEG
jgi:chorismate mutase